jgi:hypothetical protein
MKLITKTAIALVIGVSVSSQAQVPVPPDGQILSSAYTGTAYSPRHRLFTLCRARFCLRGLLG